MLLADFTKQSRPKPYKEKVKFKSKVCDKILTDRKEKDYDEKNLHFHVFTVFSCWIQCLNSAMSKHNWLSHSEPYILFSVVMKHYWSSILPFNLLIIVLILHYPGYGECLVVKKEAYHIKNQNVQFFKKSLDIPWKRKPWLPHPPIGGIHYTPNIQKITATARWIHM